MNNKHKLWVEKYRPQTIKDYIFYDDNLLKTVNQFIDEKTIPHLLFSGGPGVGKTTLINVLINELDMDPTDVLTLNASDENSVDVMRDKIKGFVSTHSFGDFKIVHLSESDYLTPNAQSIMRQLMEDYADFARFMLSANYDNKIIPAIRSRCQHFHFRKPDFDEILEHIYKILKKEHVKTDFETLEKYVTIGYPDIRKIINLVQQNTNDGRLIQSESESDSDWQNELIELIGKDDWLGARQIAENNIADEEWEDVFRFLYENLKGAGKFKNEKKWEEAIVVIGDHLYKHALVAVPVINGVAMFIRLAQI